MGPHAPCWGEKVQNPPEPQRASKANQNGLSFVPGRPIDELQQVHRVPAAAVSYPPGLIWLSLQNTKPLMEARSVLLVIDLDAAVLTIRALL